MPTIGDMNHTSTTTAGRQRTTETCIRCNEGVQAIDYDEVVTGVMGTSDHRGRLQGIDDTTTAAATGTGTATSSDAFVGIHTAMSTSIDMTFCCCSQNGQKCPRISCSFDANTRQHITAVTVFRTPDSVDFRDKAVVPPTVVLFFL